MAKLLIKGMLAGLIAGLLTFCFMNFYGEPWVDRAIAFEESVDMAAGMVMEPDLVSRQTQASFGLLTGVLVYGAAAGSLLAIAFAFAHGRLGRADARTTAMVIALVSLVAVFLVPMLKYPPNPPAVGSADTINARTELYFIMMGISVLTAIAAVMLARQLWDRLGGWNAVLIPCLAYSVVVVLAQIALPGVNEVPESFPALTLWNFRLVSISGHILFWSVLGIGFGLLHDGVGRIRAPRPRTVHTS